MVFDFLKPRRPLAQDFINQSNRESLELKRAKSKEREFREQQIISRVKRREEAARLEPYRKTGFELGRNVSRFGAVAQIEPDFTQEQMALRGMFGHGEKIWGINNNPVNINHDLNPRQRGDFGTSEMFGF